MYLLCDCSILKSIPFILTIRVYPSGLFWFQYILQIMHVHYSYPKRSTKKLKSAVIAGKNVNRTDK